MDEFDKELKELMEGMQEEDLADEDTQLAVFNVARRIFLNASDSNQRVALELMLSALVHISTCNNKHDHGVIARDTLMAAFPEVVEENGGAYSPQMQRRLTDLRNATPELAGERHKQDADEWD